MNFFEETSPACKLDEAEPDKPSSDDETFYRRYFEESPLGYLETDREGRITRVNAAAAAFHGQAKAAMLGSCLFDALPEVSRLHEIAEFQAKLGRGIETDKAERVVREKDGDEIHWLIEERLKRDNAGRAVGLIQVFRDVTEIHRNVADLRDSQRRARTLFEGIEEAVFVHSLDGKILDANPAACRLLGYSLDELLQMNTTEIDEHEFALGFAERLDRQLAVGSLKCEGRHRSKSGRTIPVEITTSSIMLDGRRAVLAVFRDISERLALDSARHALAEKNAELSESFSRYRLLTENCLDGVIVVDQLGVITLFNPAAEAIFGISAEEILGQVIAPLLPETFGGWPRPDPDFGRWLRVREPALVGRTVELSGRRKNNEVFPLELSLSAVETHGEFQFIGSIRDQTERRKMRAMLVQSDRLASIGLLSAGVAHEINNPLSYVGNNLVVLERELHHVVGLIKLYEAALPALERSDPVAARTITDYADDLDLPYIQSNLPQIIAKSRGGVERISRIVDNLRGLARTTSPVMEAAKITDLFESTIEILRVRLQRHRIDVTIDHQAASTLVCVASQIGQVLLNLLVNATQAVEARFEKNEGGQIRFRSQERDGMVIISLSDNGCGIPSENLSRLFDPFFTTKAVGDGTGLGLSICHEIITGHGGRIEVESEKGIGTTFRLVLPARPLP